MKVKVTKYLNVRVGKPSVNAPCYQYLAPGSELELDGKLYDGDYYDGLNKWMKDEVGNYYWSGGVTASIENVQEVDKSIIQAKINYNMLVNIPNEFRSTEGEDVVIAILDTGCDVGHIDLQSRIIHGFDSITSKYEIIDESTKGHGTFVSGIIAGDTKNKGVIGVAPKAKLIPIRVIRKTAVTPDNVLKGFQWLINESPITPDIINMSFDLSSDTDISEFENIIKLARKKDIFIVAAGQDYDTINKKGIYYPAENPNVIAVATLDYNIISKPDFKGVNNKIDFLIPKYTYFSTNNIIPYSHDEGSSFAAAALTGALALVVSYKKKNQIQDNAITTLKKLLPSFDKKLFENDFKIWKT